MSVIGAKQHVNANHVSSPHQCDGKGWEEEEKEKEEEEEEKDDNYEMPFFCISRFVTFTPTQFHLSHVCVEITSLGWEGRILQNVLTFRNLVFSI